MSKLVHRSRALLILATAFLIAGPYLYSHAAPVPTAKARWVIVLDAGSTKTRINLYQFRMEKATTKWIPLSTESKKWKTALSQFNPDDKADVSKIHEGFKTLFDFAKEKITDAEDRKNTPVFLYATAGLRSLPSKTAYKLLNISKEAIDKSEFDHNFPKAEMTRVQMMSGAQEGQFAWMSINYLISPNINRQTAKDDVGVIDLGGGSTQIAFRPYDASVAETAEVDVSSLWYPDTKTEAEQKVSGPGVYSKSFPDYGLSSTIMKYVGAYDECRAQKKCPSGKTYESVCLNENYNTTFKFGPYIFTMKGKAIPNEARYNKCAGTAKRIIKKYKAIPEEQINLLLHHDRSVFFGVAGYYYVAREIATETEFKSKEDTLKSDRCKGYKMSLKTFREGAKLLCKHPSLGLNNPFLPTSCIRSSYVTVLLQDTYKFQHDTVFHICSSLPVDSGSGESRMMEVGWPLGVAQQAAEKVLEKHLPTKK